MKKKQNFQIHLELKETASSIAETPSFYTCGTRQCDVCLTEKLLIAKADSKTLLKEGSETIHTETLR